MQKAASLVADTAAKSENIATRKASQNAIEALAPERESLWRRVREADFLTTAEKRAAVGYGPGGAEVEAGP